MEFPRVVDGASALPEGVKALTQGQELIKNGLDTAKERMDEMLKSLEKGEGSLTSYAAPEQGAVHSVQFVYRIDAIQSPTETTFTSSGRGERILGARARSFSVTEEYHMEVEAMRNVPINYAETILEPYWDSGESYPDNEKYSVLQNYQVC